MLLFVRPKWAEPNRTEPNGTEPNPRIIPNPTDMNRTTPNPTESNSTKPNQSETDRTNPNRTEPAISFPVECFPYTYFILYYDIPFVRKNKKCSLQTSAWWFEKTRHIAANHLLGVPHPNVSIGKMCTVREVFRAKGEAARDFFSFLWDFEFFFLMSTAERVIRLP